MTATQVIAEVDRLPPDEQKTVFVHVRMLVEDSTPEFFDRDAAEEIPGDFDAVNDGTAVMARRWIAERQSSRPRLPGAVDAFVADRRQDRA